MAGEAAFWDWLAGQLAAQLPSRVYDVQRVEDMLTQGVPDVNLCVQGREFWLELKSLLTLPARATTPVRFERYTTDQRNWLRRRWRAGGRAFLLLRVRGAVLAWNGERAWGEVEGHPFAQLMGTSCGRWPVQGFSVRAFLRDLEAERARWP